MAKDYTYYKNHVNDWLAGDIQAFSFEQKGLFSDILAWYWKKKCDVSLQSLNERFAFVGDLLNEFLRRCQQLQILEITTDEKVVIKFLNNQYFDMLHKSKVNSQNVKQKALQRTLNERSTKHSHHALALDTDTDTDIYKEDTKVSKKVSHSSSFRPPSFNEVSQYCEERNNSINPQRFLDFYSSKNWMIGKNKMKDWKAAVRTWEQNRESAQKYVSSNNEPVKPIYTEEDLERMVNL